MGYERFVRVRDWVEPAHPMTIKLHDELKAIYTRIRDKYQQNIDKAFDHVSRQIGYVVITTMPVIINMGREGRIKSINIEAEHLKGTLFDKELSKATEGIMMDDPIPIGAEPGRPDTYKIYLFWFDALKLRLRADWMEPAHFLRARVGLAERIPELALRVRPEVREPAHWFDPRISIAAEEAVLISVIDEVYPELRLLDRIASSRERFY